MNQAGPSPTILVVDDDRALLNAVRRTLEKAGYTVLTAATCPEAIERAADGGMAIDLLVTDFTLPGATGRQLADVLLRRRPELQVLYMSGYGKEDIVAAGGLREGAAFLQKPFAAEGLLRRVQELLSQDRKQGRYRHGT